jgi:integrase
MPYLSPPTLTKAEQETLLRMSSSHHRDNLVFSLALGTGLRLAEIVGLNVGDVFTADGKPRSRIRLRKEIAKGGLQNRPTSRPTQCAPQPPHCVLRPNTAQSLSLTPPEVLTQQGIQFVPVRP